MKALQKASPHGLVFKSDVRTTCIIKKLDKNKASGNKMTEWPHYGYISEVLYKQLTDERCVKSQPDLLALDLREHALAPFARFGEFWNPTNCEKFNADGSLMGRTNLDKSVW